MLITEKIQENLFYKYTQGKSKKAIKEKSRKTISPLFISTLQYKNKIFLA